MTIPGDISGLRVLVTRPAHQAEPLCKRLAAEGAEVLRFPVLAIDSLARSDSVQQEIGRLLDQDLVVFTSPNAVHCALEALAVRGIQWPRQGAPDVAAIGRATADALEASGVPVAVSPQGPYTSEGLLAHPRLHQVAGRRTMLVRGVGGREVLPETLRERGADVASLAVYRRVRPATHTMALTEILLDDAPDVAVVTSVEALDNLLALAGEEVRPRLLATGLVTVSGRAATAARVRGFHGGIIVAPEASDAGLVEGIRRWRDQQQQMESSMTGDDRKRDTETEETGTGPEQAGREPSPGEPEAPEQAPYEETAGEEAVREEPGEREPEAAEAGEAAGGDGSTRQEQTADQPPPPPRDGKSAVILVLLVLILGLGAGGGWWLYDQQQELRASLDDTASAADLAELRESAVSRAERLAGRVDNLAAEHQAHIQHLANAEEAMAQLRETQSRAREHLGRIEELAGAQRSDWISSEADYLYRVAQGRARYHQDVEGALAALRNADALLGELGGDGAEQRRDVRAAIEALVDVPRVDRSGLSRSLHELIAGVDDWPLAEVAPRLEPRPMERQPDADLSSVDGWRAAGGRAWEQFQSTLSSLVVVRREDAPPPLLSPDEEWFLREHVRIQLLTARLALHEGDEESYRSSLEQAERWMERHFRQDDGMAGALATVRELREKTIAPDLPDLDALPGGGD